MSEVKQQIKILRDGKGNPIKIIKIIKKRGLTRPLFCVIIQTDKRKGNKPMKVKILKVLSGHPNLRKREIASYLHCHHFTLITTLDEMEEDGLIKSTYHHEPEQMQFYDTFALTERGVTMLTYLEGVEIIFENLEIGG